MDRSTLQSVKAVAARRSAQGFTLAVASLVAAIILLHASAVQAAGDTAADPGSLSLRDQVRIMTLEPDASWHPDSGKAGPETMQDGAPIDQDQSGPARNLRFGAGYETRMGTRPRRE